MQLGVSKLFKPLDVLCYQISTRKRSVLKMMFLCCIFCKFWNRICGYWMYNTRKITTVLRWFASIWIISIIVGRMFIMLILILVTIFCRWMKWPLLFSTVILGGTGYFLWTPVALSIIFRSPVWLKVYKRKIMYFQ